jgi:hypothetical protein
LQPATKERALPFELGQTVITAAALEALSSLAVLEGLERHAAGDWGDVHAEDALANDRALLGGGRLVSAYRSPDGTKFWIITEADRSVTTILLPEDY